MCQKASETTNFTVREFKLMRAHIGAASSKRDKSNETQEQILKKPLTGERDVNIVYASHTSCLSMHICPWVIGFHCSCGVHCLLSLQLHSNIIAQGNALHLHSHWWS